MMKKALYLLGAGVLSIGLLAACGQEDEEASAGGSENEEEKEAVTVEHELGETTVEKNPEDVVVFDFGSLDTLDTLGVDVTGVPQANIPSYLEKYESSEYENAGGLKEPDFEKIAEINPGLIIISGRQSDAYEELSKIAPTIYLAVDTENYLASFEENVNTLAEIFEKEEQAEEELASVKEDIAALHEEASAMDEEALIVLANDGKISAYGEGSRFGIIHDEFGFKEADENIEASTHGQSVSFEYIAKEDPEYLFVIDRTQVVGGETSAEQVIENSIVEDTSAYQNDNIIYLNPNYWYLSGGGLVSVSEMVQEAEAAISE
ncbi:iron complex transport system substrate-binding protein [Alteribacillus persepolensis]|uniref:Iron complex transport system substrate-binding protein n=2 Tax=Alteribacillus persepolensis TaxID=568899 RepID=A0A1G8DU27_9BACI|nr:iron complex transport system substrate-binding protein [Alteribacillus persepolensis]